MRKIVLPILFLLFSVSTFSQQKSLFNVNIGASMYTDNESYNYDYHLSGFPSVSFEKAFHIKWTNIFRIGIHPGFNYSRYKESYESSSSALGGHFEKELTNNSLSTYSKLTFNFSLSQNNNSEIYYGMLGGIQILTHSKGIKEGAIYYTDPPYYNKEIINSSGKDFFYPFYYGFLIGFKPKTDHEMLLSPAFELSNLPNYAKTYEDKGGIIKFSVLLYFNSSQQPE